jgi:hypothetical protein
MFLFGLLARAGSAITGDFLAGCGGFLLTIFRRNFAPKM